MPWTLSAFADEAGPTCDEQILALQQAGIKHLDLRSVDHHNITALPLDHAMHVQEKLATAGITCAMFGSPLGKIDLAEEFSIDTGKLRHLGVLSSIFNCKAVRIFSYYNKKACLPLNEFRRESLDRLRRLKNLAREIGLVLYHENESHIFGDAADNCVAIAQELRDIGPGGSFRMIFDFGNFNAGKENVWEAWIKLRNHIDAFHIKDNTWSPDGEQLHHVPAGEGNGFVKVILADAVKHGFSGPCSVEAHLAHSAAVMATGPSGEVNQAYSAMSTNESFQLACRTGKQALTEAGATVI